MSNNLLIIPPNCSKCGKQMKFKTRIITYEFHKFLGVIDLICDCGYKIENVFDVKYNDKENE